MGQLDKQPENISASNSQAADSVLRAMTQDIENLRQTLVVQLSEDVQRLQKEKSQLIEDIEKLKTQRQQQLAQQQQLVKQIAPTLANQLQAIVTSRLANTPRVSSKEGASNQWEGQIPWDSVAGAGLPPTANDYHENANRLIASLDSTLRVTFKTLQQDLSSYQSSLSQQLSQMYSLEQQGEAILEALVTRLRKEIESESSAIKPSPPAPPAAPVYPPLSDFDTSDYVDYDTSAYLEDDRDRSNVSYPPERSVSEVPLMPEPKPPAALPQTPPQPKSTSKPRLGFLLILFSSLLLAFQNVVITVIFNKSRIFGLFELGGFVAPTLGNSLLVLWLRMLAVVPLMAILITGLYPAVWRDIKQFVQSKDVPLFLNVVGSGFFLFLSQVLVYLALAAIAPGVAIAIFFIYPVFTVLLTWLLFGVRPNRFRTLLIVSVFVGFLMLALPSGGGINFSGGSITAATGSAIAFALYVVLAQSSGKKLHPVPLSWINFAVILAFSGISLAVPLSGSWHFDVVPSMWPSLMISSLVLGGTTFVSYLLNNIGIKLLDAARASILGATVPALTAFLGLVIIQSTMQLQQIFGMLLVTLGVAALILERWRRPAKAPQATSRKLM
jgi:drug/metabolite transporter (DMT)-like permease